MQVSYLLCELSQLILQVSNSIRRVDVYEERSFLTLDTHIHGAWRRLRLLLSLRLQSTIPLHGAQKVAQAPGRFKGVSKHTVRQTLEHWNNMAEKQALQGQLRQESKLCARWSC